MKGSLKRGSDPAGLPTEGTKRRKQSRSSDPPPQHRSRGSTEARSTPDSISANRGSGLAGGELVELFRDAEIAQLASAFIPDVAACGGGIGGGGATAPAMSVPGRRPDAAALSEEELLSQRVQAYSELFRRYKKEYWALMEELRTRHQQFCAAGGVTFKSADPATAMADSDEEDLSVQRLYRRRDPGGSAPAATTAPAGAAAGAQAAAGTAVGVGAAASAASGAAEAASGSEASDEECPAYSDVENVLLRQDPYGPARDTAALLRGYGAFRSRLPCIRRLEECASAAEGRHMDRGGALAQLIGDNSCFLIRRTTVILGRATAEAHNVDVDLAAEGDARKVSRRAASITLRGDGCFRLRCVGRRSVRVNGREVAQGRWAALPHLSLLEAGRVRLLFAVNAGAVRRVVRRSRAVTIRQDA